MFVYFETSYALVNLEFGTIIAVQKEEDEEFSIRITHDGGTTSKLLSGSQTFCEQQLNTIATDLSVKFDVIFIGAE